MSGWGEFAAWAHAADALPDGATHGLEAGRYDGQTVYNTEHGLIYDATPEKADSRLVHPPPSFLGLPDAPKVSFGIDPLGEPDRALQGEPPLPCPACYPEAESC